MYGVKYIDVVSLAPFSAQHSADADRSSAAARLASAAAQTATLRLSNEALQAAQYGMEVELKKAHQEGRRLEGELVDAREAHTTADVQTTHASALESYAQR